MKSGNPFKHFIDFLQTSGFSIDETFINPDLPFVLSTASKEGVPSSRVLFLKQIIGEEFIFFTNKNSKKGKEIQENPHVSLCIFFPETVKQIRIEGIAKIASKEISENYFKTRPKTSQAGAILSKQSEILENYDEFAQSVRNLAETEQSLEYPESWVAFSVIPTEFEFWESREFRLNFRTKYKKDLNSKTLWFQYNLYP